MLMRSLYNLTYLLVSVVRELRTGRSPHRLRACRVRSRQRRRLSDPGSRDRQPHPARLCRHFRRDVQRRPAADARLVDTVVHRPSHVLCGGGMPWSMRRHLADSDKQYVSQLRVSK